MLLRWQGACRIKNGLCDDRGVKQYTTHKGLVTERLTHLDESELAQVCQRGQISQPGQQQVQVLRQQQLLWSLDSNFNST